MTVDPRLLAQIIRQVPPQYRALTLATALQESGGRLNAVGDQGRSFGPFQEFTGGRGHGLTPAQREDPAGSVARFLKELLTYRSRGFTGAELAYRTQRPANHGGYVQGINRLLPQAEQLLAGRGGGQPVPPMPPTQPQQQGGLPAAAGYDQARLAPIIERARVDAMNGRLDRNGLLAAIQAARLPSQAGYGGMPTAGAGAPGRLVGVHGPIIGTPGVGTHTLGNWQSDNAIDIRVPIGTPVYAPEAGVIDPKRYGSLGSSNPRMAGLRLTLLGRDPAYFAHLSRLVAKRGQRVNPGDLIGYTGSANGVSHLHFAVQSGQPQRYYQ